MLATVALGPAGCSLFGSDETTEESAKERLADLPSSEHVPDPANDEVLQIIVSTIFELSDEQLVEIHQLYLQFRADQAALVSKNRGRAGAGAPSKGRNAKVAPGRGAKGGAARPDSPKAGKGARSGKGRDDMRGRALGVRPHGKAPSPRGGSANIQGQLDKLAADFLAAGRALMRSEQLESWDDCAIAVDLSPVSRKDAGRGGGPSVGSTAPDFTLSTLEGSTVTLSSLRGKPTIVEFGSYTCPIFRNNSDEVQPLVDKYAGKANFVLVYGREAHTTDGKQVNQNIRDGIVYNQPTTTSERESIARTAISALDIESTVVIDGMDDAVTDGWDGHPNMGFILDANGKVVSTMGYIDATEIDQYLSGL